ncbi:MAG TPA: four helix bundle protein [Flavisolibacter sp.]|nr:four helix bundle protein [Flavisolibacter sp.]
MFLQLSHTKLDAFQISKQLTLECYKVTKQFPSEEKFALVQQIRRAALSVHLNIAEGCSRTSAVERKRYFEISRGSVIEIDTALDIATCLGYCRHEELFQLGQSIIRTFKILSGMMSPKN